MKQEHGSGTQINFPIDYINLNEFKERYDEKLADYNNPFNESDGNYNLTYDDNNCEQF